MNVPKSTAKTYPQVCFMPKAGGRMPIMKVKITPKASEIKAARTCGGKEYAPAT